MHLLEEHDQLMKVNVAFKTFSFKYKLNKEWTWHFKKYMDVSVMLNIIQFCTSLLKLYIRKTELSYMYNLQHILFIKGLILPIKF